MIQLNARRILGSALLALTFACALALPSVEPSAATWTDDATTSISAQAATGLDWTLAHVTWWLDSDAPGTLFSDAACTTPAGTTTGAVVRCWQDTATPGQAITTAGQGATVGPSVPGQPRMLRFVSGSLLTGPDLFGGSLDDMTIFVVLTENVASKNALVSLNGDVTSTRLSMHAPWTDRRVYFDGGDTTAANRVTSAPNAMVLGDTTILVGWKDSSAGVNGLRVNAGTATFSPGTSTSAVTTGGLHLGDNLGTAMVLDSHDIAEVLVFDYRLGTVELGAVESWLMTKWGI